MRQVLCRLVLAFALAGSCVMGAGSALAAEPEKKGDPAKPDAAATPPGGQPVSIGMYYDLPVLLINLLTNGRPPVFLKISLSLQMAKAEDRATLDARLPLLIDAFQAFLRELHAEDLRGSMGMYRLRDELLLRAAAAASPVQINDVMFKEVIIK